MMAEWPRVKLAKCVDLLSGFSFKSGQFTDKTEDIPLVKGENVSQGRILWGISKRWPMSDWNKLEKFHLIPSDVIVAMDRPWVPAGLKWAFIRDHDPKALLVQRCARLRTKNEILDQTFLRFVIGGPEFEDYVKPVTTGVTVPHISGKQILDFQFTIPPVPIQRRIASILSAYDDLIENNERRIKILEEMARSLYREWFVNFCFPGHDKVKMVPSALGLIPQGWEVRTFKDVTTKIGSGATPRGGKESYKTEGIRLIRSLNVYDYRFEFSDLAFIDERQASELDNVTVAARDILLNITGASVARCCMVPSYVMPARVNQHVSIVRTDPGRSDPYYVLDTINSQQNKQKLLAFAQGGATREALTKETIEKFPIMLPSRPLLDRYGKCAGPLHAQRETLERQTKNLRHTRDLLLPRLLSGQIPLPC